MPVDIYRIENSSISFWGKINPACPSLGQILALPGKRGHVCANEACKLKEYISKQERFANLLESDRGAEFQQVTLQVCSGHVWKDGNTNQQRMTVQSQHTEGALQELLANG